jgi:hypothetical protein
MLKKQIDRNFLYKLTQHRREEISYRLSIPSVRRQPGDAQALPQ